MGRKVVTAGIQRPEWRKHSRELGCDELKNTLGTDQVFEAMLPEVAQLHAGGQLVTHELIRLMREKDLPPRAGTQEAGDAVEGWAELIAIALLGSPRVQRHTYP